MKYGVFCMKYWKLRVALGRRGGAFRRTNDKSEDSINRCPQPQYVVRLPIFRPRLLLGLLGLLGLFGLFGLFIHP